MDGDMEKLLLAANFSRNPAHREQLRQRLFGTDGGRPDGELSDDFLKEVSGGTRNAPTGTSVTSDGK